jgi:protein-disulfide isomerase
MSDKNKSSQSTNKVEATLKGLKEELRFIRKLLILNQYGNYEKSYESEVSGLISSGEVSQKKQTGFNVIHAAMISIAILLSSLLILVGVVSTQTKSGREFLASKLKLEFADSGAVAYKSPDSAAKKGPKIAKVSVDNDPFIGDENAPVTLIEFSDFDCPWCKTFYDEVYPRLKKDYIDTGKVKLVFRDLPLESLHPDSKTKSLAANCALDQGGNEMYFKYHDELFSRAPKPETREGPLNRDDLNKIAKDLGLDFGAFTTCMDSKKYLDEVDSDIQAAFDLESYGTPSFYVGKSKADGVIEGEAMEGYAPYATFSKYIEKALQ